MKLIKLLVLIGTMLPIASCQKKSFNGKELYANVEKFVSLGEHRTGTPTDTATSYWLGQELAASGYKINYLAFPLKQFFLDSATVSGSNFKIKAFPLWWVNDSIPLELSAKISDIRYASPQQIKGNIALIQFSASGGQTSLSISSKLDSLINLGAKGIIAVTVNKVVEIVAFNTRKNQKAWKVPVLLIAPQDTSRLKTAISERQVVNLSIKGQFKQVEARNIYGTIGNGDKFIVVSTPISGWFTCGGERGPSIAVWLGLAKWAATLKSQYTFVFTGNSGHELNGIGAHEFLNKAAPPTEKTRLWIHLGAGVATLAYAKTESGLQKLATVDSLRSIFYSSPVKQSFDEAFKNVKAQKYDVSQRNGGELVYVAEKGYSRIVGLSYSHPFFHAPGDDASTTSPEILEDIAGAFKKFIELEIAH